MLIAAKCMTGCQGSCQSPRCEWWGWGPRDVDSEEKGESFSTPVWKNCYGPRRIGRLIGSFQPVKAFGTKMATFGQGAPGLESQGLGSHPGSLCSQEASCQLDLLLTPYSTLHLGLQASPLQPQGLPNASHKEAFNKLCQINEA